MYSSLQPTSLLLKPTCRVKSHSVTCHPADVTFQSTRALDLATPEEYKAEWTYTHTPLTALCPGLPRWAGTRQVKPIWILLKQETMSGSGISWAICKSAPRSRQITMPAPHHSVFYRPDALPVAQPTASKHWRQYWVDLIQSKRSLLQTWQLQHCTCYQ